MTKSWAKRELQIRGVYEATSGMAGDLEAISGQGILEIEGFEFARLPEHSAQEVAL